MKKQAVHTSLLLLLLASVIFSGCDAVFGTKGDSTTDEIEDEGRIDPTLPGVDGYAPVLPFWFDFDRPTDIIVGFDQFVYVTDARGVHLLDRADLSPRRTFDLRGAVGVAQDRNLNVYVAGRIDVVVPERGDVVWDLPAVFKIQNFHLDAPVVIDTLIFPFDDATLSTRASQISRLNKSSSINYELVEITGITTLADNSIYVSRRGPSNSTNQVAAPDNIILEFDRITTGGVRTEKMRNVRQIRALSPTTPSLLSAIGVDDIQGFVAPPQRDSFSPDRGFIIAQADQNTEIPFRVLWVNAVETVDGLEFQANREVLRRDTTQAEGFLMDPFKFQKPTGVAFAGDNTRFVFVVDEAQHMLYQFQANGEEGVIPPVGADNLVKKVVVSFGGLGNGAKQFNQPSGVAYFNRVVYVADKMNNRIARYKLTTDFE